MANPLNIFTRYYSGYVQDDFRLASNFTLNFGLRGEYESGLTEKQNRFAVAFDQDAVSPLAALTGLNLRGGLRYAGQDGFPDYQGHPNKLSLSPRVGAAWTMNPKTVLIDVPIRMVDCGGDEGGHQVGVSLVVRLKGERYAGAAHDQVSEVYHILEGAGTMIVGGKLTNPKRRPNSGGNGPGIAGDGITGGVRTRIAKGDVLIIPAGTPHQFEAADALTLYTVVRVDPSKVTPLQ